MDEDLNKTITRNSFWEFATKAIEKAGSIVFTIILARYLLPEGFGGYNLVMAVILIFIGFINYAVDETLMRYVSYALGKNNKKLASSYFRYLLKKKIIFTLSSALLVLIFAYPLSEYVFRKPFLLAPLLISGAYMLVLGIQNSYESLFYVFKELKKRAIKEILKQAMRIAAIIIVFSLVAKSYYISGVIAGLILTNLAITAFIIWYIKKFGAFIFNDENEEEFDKKKVMSFLFYLLAIGCLGAVFSYVDVLMLGFFLSEVKYLGLYSAAIALIWGVMGLLTFSSVLLPVFTQSKKEKIENKFNKVMKYSFMISIPASFGIFGLSKYIIFIFYGNDFLEASLILAVLSFLVIEGVSNSFITTLFSARGKPKYIPKITVCVLILSIILNLIFIKLLINISQFWTAVGVAVTTLISRYVSLISLIFILDKKLKIKLMAASWIKPLFASIVMAISLFMLNKFFIKDMTPASGIAEVIFGMAVYLIVMILIKGIKKEDFRLFAASFPNSIYQQKTGLK